MKKIFTYVIGLLLALGLFFGTYFLIIINSKGTDNIIYIEPETDYHSFSQIINYPSLKNKVIYVDFWHTGCGPCLIEFQSLPKLKDRFKNRQDLAFLYLGKDRSVPGEKFRWKRMIENKGLTGYHYFMTNDMAVKIWDETVQDDSIQRAFPHYLIVDRNGKIANNNSPRPSSNTIEDELNRVLDN